MGQIYSRWQYVYQSLQKLSCTDVTILNAGLDYADIIYTCLNWDFGIHLGKMAERIFFFFVMLKKQLGVH